VLTLALALVLSETRVCDETCFKNMHMLTSRADFVMTWGAPHFAYEGGTQIGAQHAPIVHRFELGWSVPLGTLIEAAAAASLDTRGRPQLSHGAYFYLPRMGDLLVPVVGLNAGVSPGLELHLRPSVALRAGPAAVAMTFDFDVGNRFVASYGVGLRLSL
jgi:hypothetical protein